MHVFQPRYFMRKTPEHFISFNAFRKFLRVANPARDLSFSLFFFFFFWGGGGALIFGPGIFGEVVGSLRDYLGFCFLPPFDHPRHLKSVLSPPDTINKLS